MRIKVTPTLRDVCTRMYLCAIILQYTELCLNVVMLSLSLGPGPSAASKGSESGSLSNGAAAVASSSSSLSSPASSAGKVREHYCTLYRMRWTRLERKGGMDSMVEVCRWAAKIKQASLSNQQSQGYCILEPIPTARWAPKLLYLLYLRHLMPSRILYSHLFTRRHVGFLQHCNSCLLESGSGLTQFSRMGRLKYVVVNTAFIRLAFRSK